MDAAQLLHLNFRRRIAPFLFVTFALFIVNLVGGPSFLFISAFWAISIAYKYARLWSDGYDWRDVFKQPRDKMIVDVAAETLDDARAIFNKEKRAEVRALTQQIVDDLVASLSAHARDAVRSPIPRIADAEAARGTMVLNAAFLVAPDGLEPFQRTLTDFATRYESRGFRFDFTGPWPAYHFAGAREEAR